MSRFGYGGNGRCSMGPKRSLERVVFSLKSPCLRGVGRHILSLQYHQCDWYFWLEWFVWINGIWGTYQILRFCDGGHGRCSMGPRRSLERVVFSLKSPCLTGVERHILGLQCRPSHCNFWLECFMRIHETWGAYKTSRLGDGGPDRCSLGPKRSLERVVSSLKSPFLTGVERYDLGLQCHQSDWTFLLE